MEKKNLAVLFGGVSSEHEISLLSATSVLENLDPARYNVLPVGITKQGRWFYYEGPVADIATGKWEKGACTPAAFCPGSGLAGLVLFEASGARALPVDVVFPVLHGKNGEDGTVQGLLELAGLPYVGCGVLGSAVCMDKIIANCAMDASGIPHCDWDWMERGAMAQFDAIEARVAKKLGYPIFVKPANAGSSVGVTKAHDKAELRAAVELAAKHDSRILFERTIVGHEVECAVLGNEALTATLPGEILASKEFYDYEDKYLSGQSRTAIPALLGDEKLREVRDIASRAYRALACCGLSRVDCFVEDDTGRVYVNEINTLPGFTSISMYPKLMLHEGYSYATLLDALVELALARGEAHHA